MSLLYYSSSEQVATYYCCSAPSLHVNVDKGNGARWRTGDRDGDGGRIRAARAGVVIGAGRRAVDMGGEGAGHGCGI